MRAQRVLIIGGGIGGLAAAAALPRAGFDAVVYERADAFREVGAGLAVWANAVRVLHHLGLEEHLSALALPVREAQICSAGGAVLVHLDLHRLAERIGVPNYVMHRHDLLMALAGLLPAEVLHTNACCTAIEQNADGVTAYFEHGDPVQGDLLIGADGIHSTVREVLWGAEPTRYSGQACYRGIATGPVRYPYVNREILGPGRRFGFCPLDDHRVYWWAPVNAPEGEADDPATRRDTLLETYRAWPWHVPEVIAHTPNEAILRNDLIDRPPRRRWSRGRVTLLGDAAHPTTPNLGQGSCMAIEDALVLARCLAQAASPTEAFAAYEAAREPRTRRITQQSWVWGILAQWNHAVAVAVRDTMTRATPRAVYTATLRRQIGYDAGPLPEPAGAITGNSQRVKRETEGSHQ